MKYFWIVIFILNLSSCSNTDRSDNGVTTSSVLVDASTQLMLLECYKCEFGQYPSRLGVLSSYIPANELCIELKNGVITSSPFNVIDKYPNGTIEVEEENQLRIIIPEGSSGEGVPSTRIVIDLNMDTELCKHLTNGST